MSKATYARLAVALAALLDVGNAHADLIARGPSETDDAFMARVLGPSAELAQKVVRSTEIAGGRVALIGFINAEEHVQAGHQVIQSNPLVGHLLIEMSPGRYAHVEFRSCDEEGGPPELLAVFFARTAKDGGRDLGVLCGWPANGGATNGMCYSALFYRLDIKGSQIVVVPVADPKKTFDTCDIVEVNRHGKWIQGSKARFKTVRDVKQLLERMGIRQ